MAWTNKTPGYNPDNFHLNLEALDTEDTVDRLDIISNGFKGRIVSNPNAAETYIFAAFAEFPFGGEDVSQARAR